MEGVNEVPCWMPHAIGLVRRFLECHEAYEDITKPSEGKEAKKAAKKQLQRLKQSLIWPLYDAAAQANGVGKRRKTLIIPDAWLKD